METIISNTEFSVTFNGSENYYVTDNTGYAWLRTSSKRKALNYFKKVSANAGVN